MIYLPHKYFRDKLSVIPFMMLLLAILMSASLPSVPIEKDRPDHSIEPLSGLILASSGNNVIGEDINALASDKAKKWSNINWNWFVYIGILLMLLYIIRRYELSRLRLRNQMRIANIETVKLKEIDLLKSKFYTNISHEFRTPLTLIKGPLEELIESNTDSRNISMYKTMHGNASRLLELINQLLDLSKIESGIYSLKAHQGDVVNFIEGLAYSYASLADQRSIKLEVKVSPELMESEERNSIFFDPDILDKIVNNLISNAFKFTPEKGNITVSMNLSREDQLVKYLVISVKDTGVGIEPDQLPFIFNRF